MVTNKKNVRFDQVRPFYLEKDENEVSIETPCNLRPLLSAIGGASMQQTLKEIRGDKYRFHVCRLYEKERFWEIQVLRLRERVLPGIATEDGDYQIIQLEDGEYPAESVTLLYDEDRCTLYVQRNIYGISPSSLGTYIQYLQPNGTNILLKPIVPQSKIGLITPAKKYRRIIFTCNPDYSERCSDSSSLSRILQVFNRYQGSVISVSIGFGRKSGFLRSDEASDLIQAAYREGAQKLEVRMADDEDVEIHTIDLLDNRESYVFEMEYSRQNPITHNRLFMALKDKFLEDNLR